MKTLTYDTDKYNFHRIISDFLDGSELDMLESDVEQNPEESGFSIYKQMERASAYGQLYAALESERGRRFYDTFERFVREVVRPRYDGPILYQETPTHRIHFRNSIGQSRFHRDTDYGHNEAEINYSVPQTRMFETNSIWIESASGRGDFTPMDLEVGQFAEFKGATLEHGAKANRTGRTRVSFDFRVIPVAAAPEQLVDTSSWKERDRDNPLFQNAHLFAKMD